MANKARIAKNVFFILGALTLGIMIYKIGLENIWHEIKQTGWWFVPILSMWIVIYLLNTITFYIILRDGSPESEKVSFIRLFKLTISGFAINYITPFGLMGGEPYKIIELKDELGIQKATSSVLLTTMMHFVSHFLFWVITIPMLFFLVPVISDSIEIGLIISGGTAFLLLLWAYRIYAKGGVNRALIISSKLPFVGKRIRIYKEKHQEKIDQMDVLIADLYQNRKKDFIASLSIELLSRFLICFEIMLMMKAVKVPVTLVQSVLIESIQSLISNLFFFMPMQMGAREGGFVIIYGILSLPVAYGVFVSLCKRIRELFWTLIGVLLIKAERR
ncbi:MAG: lysylphosphatidylglycerol synthase transmembrane domain-containing protein [Fermentimonas sp.]|nr:lysylphosphatidylglycerol synthase transmembrane domain-containing protein [Fermentimonas sp.]